MTLLSELLSISEALPEAKVTEAISAGNDVFIIRTSGSSSGGKWKENAKLIDSKTRKVIGTGSPFMLSQMIMKKKLNLIEVPKDFKGI